MIESIPVVAHSTSLEASTPLSATIPSPSPSAPPSVTDDVDLDAFYADIGLNNEEPEEESEPAPTEDPPLSEEQLEELRLKKLADTAEKRRDITGSSFKVGGEESDNFTDLANSIQNGSHPSPPIDPVPGAIHEFQLEVEDVITGFETRFRHIQRNGLKALESSLEGVDGDEDTDKDTELPQSPEVSVLPIPGNDPNSASPISESDFPVVGRGKVEVEEALRRAEAVLAGKHAEVAIEGEVDQSAPRLDTPTAAPSSVSPLHTEL
ncbi:hypothetical protein EDB83DRAFT_2515717 [Lactarius deliciosus]|nr:hypothetical protein EDB83DRAFT_2515717 [Lactarius deliciosus]